MAQLSPPRTRRRGSTSLTRLSRLPLHPLLALTERRYIYDLSTLHPPAERRPRRRSAGHTRRPAPRPCFAPPHPDPGCAPRPEHHQRLHLRRAAEEKDVAHRTHRGCHRPRPRLRPIGPGRAHHVCLSRRLHPALVALPTLNAIYRLNVSESVNGLGNLGSSSTF